MNYKVFKKSDFNLLKPGETDDVSQIWWKCPATELEVAEAIQKEFPGIPASEFSVRRLPETKTISGRIIPESVIVKRT